MSNNNTSRQVKVLVSITIESDEEPFTEQEAIDYAEHNVLIAIEQLMKNGTEPPMQMDRYDLVFASAKIDIVRGENEEAN